jgi:hypothetical protein
VDRDIALPFRDLGTRRGSEDTRSPNIKRPRYQNSGYQKAQISELRISEGPDIKMSTYKEV